MGAPSVRETENKGQDLYRFKCLYGEDVPENALIAEKGKGKSM